jgi:hypothetical protein
VNDSLAICHACVSSWINKLLVRRAREAFEAPALQGVGTSATLGGSGDAVMAAG